MYHNWPNALTVFKLFQNYWSLTVPKVFFFLNLLVSQDFLLWSWLSSKVLTTIPHPKSWMLCYHLIQGLMLLSSAWCSTQQDSSQQYKSRPGCLSIYYCLTDPWEDDVNSSLLTDTQRAAILAFSMSFRVGCICVCCGEREMDREARGKRGG